MLLIIRIMPLLVFAVDTAIAYATAIVKTIAADRMGLEANAMSILEIKVMSM